MTRLIGTIAALLFVSGLSLTAGDVSYGVFLYPTEEVNVGDDAPVEFKLDNPLGFDVTGLKLSVQIRYDGELVYDETEELDKVEKNSDVTYKMSTSFKINFAGTYNLDASFTTDGSDIDESNNQTSFSFSARYRVDKDAAKATFDETIQSILEQYKGTMTPGFDQFYCSSMALSPGTSIRFGEDEDDEYVLDDHSYLFLFDLAPYQKLAHFSGYVAVNANDAEADPVVAVGESWTTVDGMAVPGSNNPNYVLYYNPDLVESSTEDPPIVSTPIDNDPPSKTCAILIAGRRHPNGTFDDHTKVFKGDVDSVYKEITTEKGGMNIAADNIERLYNPSEEDIYNAAERLSKKGCTKLLFYYSGHGFKAADDDKFVSLFIKDGGYPGLPMSSAMDYAAGVGATDHVFIFDCCYAGDAIRQLPNALELDGKNVIILASSHKDSLSKTDIRVVNKDGGGKDTVGRSEYTKALLESWGKTGVSTPLEAHNDVVKTNPKLKIGGKNMNDAMKPQSYGSETKKAADGDISFDGMGLDFVGAMGLNPDAVLRVTTWGPVEDFGSTDATVNSTSSYRAWNITLMNQMDDFSTGIRFTYDPELDGVFGSQPGIIRREGAGAWSAIPTEINNDNLTLTVRGITSFSDWAVANTTLDPVSVDEDVDLSGSGLALRLRSGVAHSSVTFDLTSTISGSFQGAVIAANSGQVVTRFEITATAGTTVQSIATSGLASGVYLLTLDGATMQTVSSPFVVVR